MKLTETKDGTIIEIFVKPNSQKFELSIEGEEIVIHCTEEPTKGKANKELLRELNRLFHRKVVLVSGATSREKRLLIQGIGKDDVKKLLNTDGV